MAKKFLKVIVRILISLIGIAIITFIAGLIIFYGSAIEDDYGFR